jgi:uncharacterized membrane protein YbaN (DUF454 family)
MREAGHCSRGDGKLCSFMPGLTQRVGDRSNASPPAARTASGWSFALSAPTEGANDDTVAPARSPLVRGVLIAAGLIAVALGVIGIFLPVVPTVPFLILAAACFARASPRLYRWIAYSKWFGPQIREWRRHRSVPWRAKLAALAMMAVGFTISIAFFAEPVWLKIALATIGLAVGIWLYRLPSRDRPNPG